MENAHPNHRQQEILDALRRAGGSLRVHRLARELQVSEETVRRNLKRLAESGQVEKVHGGARLAEDTGEGDFQHRLRISPEAKQIIARHVAAQVRDGSSLFLDVGSTTSYIADALRDHAELLVVTNSVSVAYKLATRNANQVYMAGGALRAHDGGAFGAEAMRFANNFKTDLAVLSSAGITAQNGFMLYDLEEANFSRAILRNAGRRWVAADSTKFGRAAPITLCDPALINVLVTDAAPPPDLVQAASDWGTDIQVAA
ncbi:DeoR/GlpR transcriptional regulator [Pseudohalocynthiibacter aestuariivivens]|uniref:DeoR/GlpR family DNA-binding transcription regulator n=1 Tax=Roseovarius pelagicus TaxID=2980108 RepID=A0ABY6DBE6_9RHOB|nr:MULTISPECIES: DeoR/GlpR family DNA-binding transcription regulator [Rhodobacterales]QIE44624.1 DeoR/GlpR transcriptional regulator [Pseudohalocynthiibacter aestuariivivens]UXX83474.1 DeoR/GlpR family DNA-binding transcription regulator [Roseovarius pelagicus]